MTRSWPIEELKIIGEGMIDGDVQKVFLILWESKEPITRETLQERLSLRKWGVLDLEDTIRKGIGKAWIHQFIKTPDFETRYLEISNVGRHILEAIYIPHGFLQR